MRRKTRLSIRRKMSGSLACLLTAISVLSTSSAIPAMASENSVKMSYKQEKLEKIGIQVEAENESFSAGSEVLLNVYIQNNSGETLTDGTLKWFDKKETLSKGGFVYDSEYNEAAADEATPDSADEVVVEETVSAESAPAETEAAPVESAPVETETVPVETEAAPVETEAAPAETEAGPAGPSEETTVAAEEAGPAGPSSDVVETTAAAGPASDNGEFGTAWEDDWFEDEDADEDSDIEGPYLDAEGNLCNIDLAPGEIFTAQFAGTIDEDIYGLKTRDIRFAFGARKENGRRLSNNYKFQFNTGLMTMLPVEFTDGNQVEANEEHSMILRLGLDDIEYMFEEIENSKETVITGTPSEAVPASPSEAEKEFTPAEVIKPAEDAEMASPSEATMATPSEAEEIEAEIEAALAEEEETADEKATPSEAAENDDEDEDEEGVFHPEDVKYTIETYGVRLKGVKARFDEEASGSAESVTEVSYRVASGTEPGLYFGKVTASVKFNGNTYKTVQGFHINVTGEGQMVLKGMYKDSEIVVSGPAESFPDGEILSLKISEITEEQRVMLEEALKKMAEETGTTVEAMVPMDIKVIADGAEQELNGPVSVTFSNMELESTDNADEEKSLIEKARALLGEEEQKEIDGVIDVWHLDEDAIALDKLDSSVTEDGDVVMTTDHFSVKVLTLSRAAVQVNVVKADPALGVTVGVFNYNESANEEGLGLQGYHFFQGNYTDDEKEGSVDGAKHTGKGALNQPTMEKTLSNGYPNTTSGSMDYLFDETYRKGTMSDGGGLFQKDADGYFYYDSQYNSAYYENGSFTLYDTAVRPKYTQTNETDVRWGNFLPFNGVAGKVTVDGTLPNGTQSAYLNEPVDLWFGMTVEFDFFMPKDGKLNEAAMKFDFHGDDDVYVYIDDVLILDIGGTHGAQSATIDFSTGIATDPNGNKGGRTLKEIFSEANKTDVVMDGNTFADYTQHKLKFFYMERGGNISYCRLRFNMPTLPDNSLTVTKELTAESPKVTDEMEEYIRNNPDYQFKFRVVKTRDDGTTSDGLFIPAGTEYEILENGVSTNQKGVVDTEGYFSLKPGRSAQFTNMLDLGKGYKNYNYKVEEVMPNSLKAQYDGAEISIGSGTGTMVTGTSSDSFTTLSTGVLKADEVNAVTYRNWINVEKTVEIQVTKKWEDESDACESRPDTVTFKLYVKNGDEEVAYSGKTQTLTLSENGTNTRTGTFENLPMRDADGKVINYVVREMDGETPVTDGGEFLKGKYTVNYSAMSGSETEKAVTVTNTHKHGITVNKVWVDELNTHESVYYGIFKSNGSSLESVDGEAHELTAGTGSKVELAPTASTEPYIIRELEEVENAAEADFTDTTTGKETSGKHFKVIADGGRFGDFYQVTYAPSSGSTAACESTVTITNTLSKATIKIGKWIDNYDAKLAGEQFIVNVNVGSGEIKTGLVLAHDTLSKGIEVYAGDGRVKVSISEIVPKEYEFVEITQGSDAEKGQRLTASNGAAVDIPVKTGDEIVLWVHNNFTHKGYFHNSAEKMNDFDPVEKLGTRIVETAAIVPERKEWEQLLNEAENM